MKLVPQMAKLYGARNTAPRSPFMQSAPLAFGRRREKARNGGREQERARNAGREQGRAQNGGRERRNHGGGQSSDLLFLYCVYFKPSNEGDLKDL